MGFRWIIDLLIGLPERLVRRWAWIGPLLARITVGWVFLWAGWGKLGALPQVTENFRGWGVLLPDLMAPFVSGLEFAGGVLLLLGLCTRVIAALLMVVMVVAIRSAFWSEIDSLEYLLGLSEMAYLAIFLWLALAGPGAASLDALLQRGMRSDAQGMPKISSPAVQ